VLTVKVKPPIVKSCGAPTVMICVPAPLICRSVITLV
jgi:hypothetical protein